MSTGRYGDQPCYGELVAISVIGLIILSSLTSCDSGSVEVDTQASATPAISLRVSVLEDGTASPLWTEGIAIAIGEQAAENFRQRNMPFTPEASDWLTVLREGLPQIAERAEQLGSLFDVSPINAVIVAGNRGSSDAFGWVPDRIGINVQSFAETYGPPGEGAHDRMVRIAAHEYLHLVTYAFYEDHLERRNTPIDRALWTMFFEGIGDYVSVSERWLPDEHGNYSAVSAETLDALEPVLVERLEQMFVADLAREKIMRRGIASGKFDEKWGSLPVALWLHREVRLCGESKTLQAVMRLERSAVLLLASRHISPELRPRVLEIQRAFMEQSNLDYGGQGACLPALD